jgi:hypothetical protein
MWCVGWGSCLGLAGGIEVLKGGWQGQDEGFLQVNKG